MKVGLTGGIGAGKSTAAALLAHLGATVVDIDEIAREVTAPGTYGHAQMAQAFPAAVRDGVVDRRAVAREVFADPQRLRQLEALVHPLVAARLSRLDSRAAGVVVVDHPLLVEKGTARAFDSVVVVRADEELRRARLRERGMDDADITARMAAQASDAQRAAVADFVIDNSRSLTDLQRQVAALWEELSEAAQRVGGGS